MKFLKNIIPAIILAAILFSPGCDEIDAPYTKQFSGSNGDTDKVVQKVLIEEFTGYRCPNCPAASAEAIRIADAYPDQVYVLTIHAGPFAFPVDKEAYDFRTDVGAALKDAFNIVSFPRGLVNRSEYHGELEQPSDNWGLIVQELVKKEPKVTIELVPFYNDNDKELGVEVTVTYLEAGSSNEALSVYAVEDSIAARQIDGSDIIEDYVHKHVLRGSFNGVWGDQLSDSDIPAGEVIEKNYSLAIPDENLPNGERPWNPEKIKILAFVHDFNRSGEILQVEEADLIN